jgi:sigma-B regulation protein RsbU (phosphoserine phosphatase)
MYCDKTGGDYYDFFRVGAEDEERFAVVVGDVSGHGLPAALLMASARGLIRLRASMPGEAVDIVQDVNRQLCRDTDETGQFMTLFYGDVNASQGMLNWVTAGHDPPLLYDRQADAIADLAGQGLALGLFEGHGYAALQHRLEPGQMFGKTALKDVLRLSAAKSAQDIQAAVTEALKRFRGEQPLEDDVTMVVVKVEPGVEKSLDPSRGRL